MSKRRKIGDWVYLTPGAGMRVESGRLKAEIKQGGSTPCFLCDDPDCIEWVELSTEPDWENDGMRHTLCHVGECEMFDEPQVDPELTIYIQK